jgi:pSer/pThr/pTyr-binding forkhead associated (FHA) protein
MPDLGPPAAPDVQSPLPDLEPIADAYTTAIPRAALRPAVGRIRVREGRNAAYDVELKHTVTVIGRGTDADVRLTDQAVSRRHAEIRLVNGATLLNDLQSTNGTTVNGVAVTTTALKDGDEVKLGETVLIFHAGIEPATHARGEQGRQGGRGQDKAPDVGSWS